MSEVNSVGAVWPPTISTDNRLRGFYSEKVVRTQEEVSEFAARAQTFLPQLGSDSGCDRLSIRLVTSENAVASIDQTGLQVEAAIPFAYGGEGLTLTYVGHNQAHRVMSAVDLIRHRTTLQHIVQSDHDRVNPAIQLHKKGFSPQMLDINSPEERRTDIVGSLTELYSVFGYDQAATNDLVTNPSNFVAYIEDNDSIISTATAERVAITVKGLGALQLVEITDGVTHPAYKGRGLFKAIYGYLVNKMLAQEEEQPIDVLYSESNLAVMGMLMASHKIGQRYNYFDAGRFGLQNRYFGILPQSFSVKDGIETRSYNDFAVSYTPLG
ncbi:MAG TPA: GNAT family N-acetyltransferase [Candidatus Saccharimonadales bacterium]|nr:GNAT family N-acetyltransferase [Candidatus Saccharimonadales bacterium]